MPGEEPYAVTFLKNLKYVLLGALAAYQLDVPSRLAEGVSGVGLGARAIQLSGVLSAVTVAIMLYLVVWLPRIVGQVPNYSRWMSTSPLNAVIPLLTCAMLGGYTSLVVGLLNVGPHSLGWLRAIGGALGVYASVFGMLGLIPTPRPARVLRRD